MIKGLSRFAIKYGLIPIAYGILRLYFLLIRIRPIGEEEILRHLSQGGKAIVALFHQRALCVVTYARRFGVFSPSAMISQSRDGEMIAQVARLLNFRPVRGSSSRGGREALAEIVADLSVNSCAAHAVDGPQGPRGVVKAGVIRMAQRSGAPIVLVSISVNRAWVLKSWDRFLIPKPFSTIVVRWDDPIPVPETLSSEEFETIRRAVETRMRESHDEQDRKCGWRESLLA